MPHLVPVSIQQSPLHVMNFHGARFPFGGLTRKHFLWREIVVKSSLGLMTVMAEAIPLASRLDVHVQPVVKDHGSVGMVGHAVIARRASESWLCGKRKRPAVKSYKFEGLGEW
jgi:hypothetical protein